MQKTTYPFTNADHKWWSYDVWFLRYQARQTEFFVISDYFLPFYPINNPENQNFEKMKKTPGGIIILNMSTINENHIMYDSWDMEHDRQNFFAFWTIFCPFTPPSSPPSPLTTQKPRESKFWKNEKNTWRYHHFTQVYHKWQSYDIWFLRYEVHQPEFFCHLGSSWLDSDRILARLMIIGYTVPEIWHVTDVIVIFHSGLHFSLLPP